jgi:hypothetical protein
MWNQMLSSVYLNDLTKNFMLLNKLVSIEDCGDHAVTGGNLGTNQAHVFQLTIVDFSI